MIILGIETSCDETAVAIVDDKKNILSHIVSSQIDLHQKYGGVVPEIAARSHIEILDQIILQALDQANLNFSDIDGFAATSGPGLIGGVIVGMMSAKTLASFHKKPFIAINHLEAHALTVRLTNNVKFPYLLLLISGGHCQIALAKSASNYEKIGETIDDALGEAFDKVAKMLGLNYPGGPEIEKLAIKGDGSRFKFPLPLIDNFDQDHQYNFSFSGLKSAVLRVVEKFRSSHEIDDQAKCDICASFQKTIISILINRLNNVITVFKTETMVIAGGVAANQFIFEQLSSWANGHNINLIIPPIKLCTDNGAMIAWNGIEKLKAKQKDPLDFKPKARWELSTQ